MGLAIGLSELQASNKIFFYMDNLVSVIIPYYFGEDYIKECLESVFKQSYTAIEVIIVNDGSPRKFLDELKNTDYPNLIIYHQENQGQSAARNKGVDLSCGKFILFLDCDDKLDTSYIEKTHKILTDHADVKICYTKGQYFEGRNGEWELPKFKLESFLFENCIPIGALFYKSDFIKVGGFDTNLTYFEDWDLWISIIKNGGKVSMIDEELYYYRIRDTENSLTDRHINDDFTNGINRFLIYQKHYDFYEKNNYNFNQITNIILSNNYFKDNYYNVWYRKLIYRLFKRNKYNIIYQKR